ncbi:unnamed protein product [Moneuplotes crassus]|uniref:Uncharacterized protein n=1 Tax=Euplotes crassus TaxID=5936 RepID=A0AAD1XWK3_EUPCR|nr:unnamed protein product [Moneuplotes crassus]
MLEIKLLELFICSCSETDGTIISIISTIDITFTTISLACAIRTDFINIMLCFKRLCVDSIIFFITTAKRFGFCYFLVFILSPIFGPKNCIFNFFKSSCFIHELLIEFWSFSARILFCLLKCLISSMIAFTSSSKTAISPPSSKHPSFFKMVFLSSDLDMGIVSDK